MSQLALLGGTPAVTAPKPHFVWPRIGGAEVEAVLRQLRIGAVSIRDRSGVIKEFEDEFASYHGMQFAVSTNSGTTAIHSAMFGCGIGPGDEVIAPTYTFLATVTPILHVNATPVLVDSEPDTGNIDAGRIESAITPRTKAIIVTHLSGHPCDMDAICRIAHDYEVALIEDCSQAHGAEYKGSKVGTFGDVSCFSLQGGKTVSAGEGGILLTNSTEIYERATLLGHFGPRSQDCVKSEFYSQFVETGYGLKYRMHPLGAALAREGLRRLDEHLSQRNANLELLSELLSGIPGIKPLARKPYVARHGYHRYVATFQPGDLPGVGIDLYMEALEAEGVEAYHSSSPPLHAAPLLTARENGMYEGGWPLRGPHSPRELNYKLGDFPEAEMMWKSAIRLPTFTDKADLPLIEAYANAFRKVGAAADELRRRAEEDRSRVRDRARPVRASPTRVS